MCRSIEFAVGHKSSEENLRLCILCMCVRLRFCASGFGYARFVCVVIVVFTWVLCFFLSFLYNIQISGNNLAEQKKKKTGLGN